MIDSVYSSGRRVGWNELWVGNENLAEFRQARGRGSSLMRYRREKEREIDRRVYSSRLYITYIIDARIETG